MLVLAILSAVGLAWVGLLFAACRSAGLADEALARISLENS